MPHIKRTTERQKLRRKESLHEVFRELYDFVISRFNSLEIYWSQENFKLTY